MGTSRTSSTRSDAIRNRRGLLAAAGELLREAPDTVTVLAVARRAGLSPATAYRYFPTLEQLRAAYLHEVVLALRDYSQACGATGTDLFEETLHEWGRLLEEHGTAMVALRSRRGFLERLRANDDVITTVRDAWERPIRAVMATLNTPPEYFDHALQLCNLLVDPREILDLLATGMTMPHVLDHLTRTYYGAITAWTNIPTTTTTRLPAASKTATPTRTQVR
jgi:AcrR family transcriptional regulator